MAWIWKLDKILKAGTVYETPKRVGYVIKKIGTNSSTSTAKLVIDRKEVGEIDADVAPLRPTSSNKLGLLDLGELYYVVPPETKFYFEGDSGSYMRIVGDIVQVEAGEGLPGDLMTRFAEQTRKFVTTVSGSLSLATDEAWGADEEKEVYTLTPLTIEKYTFNNFLGVNVTGNTVNPGDFAIIFKMDNIPFELDVAESLMYGVDALSAPLPPDAADGEEPFTLKETPIEVMGDRTLSILLRNTSGADKSPTAGSAWGVTMKAIVVYEKS